MASARSESILWCQFLVNILFNFKYIKYILIVSVVLVVKKKRFPGFKIYHIINGAKSIGRLLTHL